MATVAPRDDRQILSCGRDNERPRAIAGSALGVLRPLSVKDEARNAAVVCAWMRATSVLAEISDTLAVADEK